jgi:hypothetical protein
MDTEFFSDGYYADAPEGKRVQIDDLIWGEYLLP